MTAEAQQQGPMMLGMLPIDMIDDSGDNIRRDWKRDGADFVVPDEAMGGLAETMKDMGVLSPILVTPLGNGRYKRVAGQRRLMAAKQAGLTQVPVMVRDLDEGHQRVAQLIENLQRQSLSAVDEAEAIVELLRQTGLSMAATARRLGIPVSRVEGARRLHNDPVLRDGVQSGRIAPSDAYALHGLDASFSHPLYDRLRDGQRVTQRDIRDARQRQHAAGVIADPGANLRGKMQPSTQDKMGKAQQLRAAGKTYSEIGKELGVSLSRASELVHAGTNRRERQLSPNELRPQIQALHAQGWSQERIANDVGVTKATVAAYLSKPTDVALRSPSVPVNPGPILPPVPAMPVQPDPGLTVTVDDHYIVQDVTPIPAAKPVVALPAIAASGHSERELHGILSTLPQMPTTQLLVWGIKKGMTAAELFDACRVVWAAQPVGR